MLYLILSVLFNLANASTTNNCQGRDLSAFKMSPLYYNGEKVKPFLLTPNYTKYIPCSGQQVLLPNDPKDLQVGIISQGKMLVVNYAKLYKNSYTFKKHSSAAKRILPEVTNKIVPYCYNQNNTIEKFRNNLLPEMKKLIYYTQAQQKQKTFALVQKFNTTATICKKIQNSNNRLDSLLEQWHYFCIDKDELLCQRAMEIDMLSRTISFEANGLGILDKPIVQKTSLALSKPTQAFTLSNCERRFIAMTLRNRKYKSNPQIQINKIKQQLTSAQHGESLEKVIKKNKRLHKKLKRLSLAQSSPYFYDGLYGGVYNIWFDKYTKTSYITSCFGNHIKLPPNTSQNTQRMFDIFKKTYWATLPITYETLYNQEEANKKIAFRNSQTGKLDPIHNKIKHYYHAKAMPKCYMKTKDKTQWEYVAKAKAVVACRKITKQGQSVEDCVLTKNEGYRLNPKTKEIQWIEKKQHSTKFYFGWTHKDKWFLKLALSPNKATLYPEVQQLTNKYKYSKSIKYRFCEKFYGNENIGTKAPNWAKYGDKPRSYTLECQNESDTVTHELGGIEDPRIIPVYIQH